MSPEIRLIMPSAFALPARSVHRITSVCLRLKAAASSAPVPLQRHLSTARVLPTEIDLQAPNGHRWKQPTGLFINHEFVESSNGSKIETVDPLCVSPLNGNSPETY